MELNADDIDTTLAWWNNISATIPADVHGLWFGLFRESSGSKAADGRFTMYVSGTRQFSASDDDWATEESWRPENRYVRPTSLSEIASSDWQQALKQARQLVQQVEPWTASSTIDGVGVGFDGGDVEIVWTQTAR